MLPDHAKMWTTVCCRGFLNSESMLDDLLFQSTERVDLDSAGLEVAPFGKLASLLCKTPLPKHSPALAAEV
eukprot:SAG31_NODE_40686_length_279_cov_1.105556_1_plen_70_part_10